ncbi:hypothetical protein DFJ58DRAFT_689142 [Suillus subalutaceus]|uniref:uncharacterized protein n=1 Tax=Suillus subalutaceus TaxID=48586 RepID=UPI001B87D191|nr:uncharacterized protein DFJ58DRAFT_689142 [Suillus subalutaceus]KAG1840614.1 hypothetical protein DFJ58DRAFT_689142 [Suillus subalutaceus]
MCKRFLCGLLVSMSRTLNHQRSLRGVWLVVEEVGHPFIQASFKIKRSGLTGAMSIFLYVRTTFDSYSQHSTRCCTPTHCTFHPDYP